MKRRLPPHGTPARAAHEGLLAARRSLSAALFTLRDVNLDDDSRASLREYADEVGAALTEVEMALQPESSS